MEKIDGRIKRCPKCGSEQCVDNNLVYVDNDIYVCECGATMLVTSWYNPFCDTSLIDKGIDPESCLKFGDFAEVIEYYYDSKSNFGGFDIRKNGDAKAYFNVCLASFSCRNAEDLYNDRLIKYFASYCLYEIEYDKKYLTDSYYRFKKTLDFNIDTDILTMSVNKNKIRAALNQFEWKKVRELSSPEELEKYDKIEKIIVDKVNRYINDLKPRAAGKKEFDSFVKRFENASDIKELEEVEKYFRGLKSYEGERYVKYCRNKIERLKEARNKEIGCLSMVIAPPIILSIILLLGYLILG